MYSILLLCIIVTLLFNGSAAVPLQKRLSGVATFYAVGLGACGQTNTPDQLIAAAGASRFDSETASVICGQKATITGPKGSVTVTILDRCVACGFNDLDLSTGAFNQIADPTQGRVPITWTLGGGGSGGGSGGGDSNAPAPPKAAPAAPAPAPTSTTTTSTTTTSTSTTSTSTSTTSTSTSTTTSPTPTPDANNVAAAFFMGSIFSDLANVNTPANSTTTNAAQS